MRLPFALPMQQTVGGIGRPSRAAPDGEGGHPHADRRADGAGHDEPARMTPDPRGSLGTRQARAEPRLEPCADQRRCERGTERGGRIKQGTLVEGQPHARRSGADRGAKEQLIDRAVEPLGPRGTGCHVAPANTAERRTLHAYRSGEHIGQVPQCPELEHPHRSLAAAEHSTDLTSRLSIHEAQDHDVTPVSRQRRQRTPQPPALLRQPEDAGRVVVDRRLDDSVERRRPLPAARPQRVGQLVVRDAEEPGSERGALVSKSVDAAERGEERTRGDLLGVVLSAEEIEAVAVDAVQVAPVERAELAPIALRGANIPEIRVDRGWRTAPRLQRHAGTPRRTFTTSPLAITWRPSAASTTSAPVSSRSTARPSTGPLGVATVTKLPSVVQAARYRSSGDSPASTKAISRSSCSRRAARSTMRSTC